MEPRSFAALTADFETELRRLGYTDGSIRQYHQAAQDLRVPATWRAPRDTFKLLLEFCQGTRGLAIERLTLRDIDDGLIMAFLDWLETVRHNSVTTRNQRLACLHGFYRYLQGQDPAGGLQELLLSLGASQPAAGMGHAACGHACFEVGDLRRVLASQRRDEFLGGIGGEEILELLFGVDAEI